MTTFIANLKHAILNKETVCIGGGKFKRDELLIVYDNIKALINAEKTEHDRRLEVETGLVNLLCVISKDKDGGFFICAEGASTVADAQKIMGVSPCS